MIGPYTSVDLGNGQQVDLYLLRFDKEGRLLSPQTWQLIRERLPGHTDVFVFSHGWNNTFNAARDRYLAFIQGYAAQRARLGLPAPEGYRPLLIGVIWPSTSFVLPWEQGPVIAATPDPAGQEQEELLRLVGEELDPETYAALAEALDGVEGLTQAEAERAAEILLGGLSPGDAPEDAKTAPTPAELVEAWRALDGGGAPAPRPPDDFGGIGGAGGGPGGGDGGGDGDAPQAAGGAKLDPRGLLRTATVWLMKDRAGKVGAHGVAPLLQTVLTDTDARLHLVGHSFGARVMLSAATLQQASRKVRSILLLQPAVNRWCFADQVIDRGIPGGYRPVLDKVEQPVVTTFSRHDVPLYQAFHLAVRGSSLGEPDIAAVGDTHRYGALGGYGPAGIDSRLAERTAQREGQPYDLGGGADPTVRVVQVDGDVADVKVPGVDNDPGDPAIDGHGDINTTVTWWLMHTLAAPAPPPPSTPAGPEG